MSDTKIAARLFGAAKRYHENGLCVLPAKRAKKRPTISWKKYQSTRPTKIDIGRWFASKVDAVCIVCGKTSGNLEVIDFDCKGELFPAWRDKIPVELFEKLVIESTQSGGRHVIYRYESSVCSSLKLATRGKTTYIETRGEGGLFLCAPTSGYEVTQGDLANPPILAKAERDTLLQSAYGLDERQQVAILDTTTVTAEKPPPVATPLALDRPGDDFNKQCDPRDILTRHGWQRVKGGDNEHWRRPGKTVGMSATLKDGTFFVFSSNASPFEPDTGYSPLAVCAMLDHGGDFGATARALRLQGFGGDDVVDSDVDLTGILSKKNGKPKAPTPTVATYRPFPVELLPEPIRTFIIHGAEALGCDPAFVALPMLAALASAIGNARRIQLKASWSEPAIIWTAIIGESGTLKSPAFRLATESLHIRQKDAFKRHAEALEVYESEALQHAKSLAQWKRSKDGGDPPPKPDQPQAERCLVGDTTIEALIPILQANPRGVLLSRDELAGWFGSFDRYTSKGGGDVANWLSLFNGESVTVDRKTSPTIHVPNGLVSVTGGIQPGILAKMMTSEHREAGLQARFLSASPPRKPKTWSEATIPVDVATDVKVVFGRLFELQPDLNDDGSPRPQLVKLNPTAKRRWVRFHNEHAAEQAGLTGDLAAAWSKLEAYAARLALVHHCVRVAAGDETLADPDKVDEVSMAAGVGLARWFGGETKRVYATMAESNESRDLRRLTELVRNKGGVVSVRDWQNRRHCATTADAEAELDGLVEAGLGCWEVPQPTGSGRPTSRRFILSSDAQVGDE
ncbi:MAG: DUF3987 domain-containing protein [Phycisphaerae bacterium]|nr:DUF3987 domain-containing protein [Phycisphaerae bacterium]